MKKAKAKLKDSDQITVKMRQSTYDRFKEGQRVWMINNLQGPAEDLRDNHSMAEYLDYQSLNQTTE